MDDLHVDALARGLASSGTRRRVLTGLATLPVVGGLLGILDADDAEAGGRMRKKRRRRRKNKQKNRCQPDCAGTCGGASDGCGGTCGDTCPAGQVCAGESCEACDVCASGCAHATIQAAIAAASAGDTIRLCAGTYALAADETIDIDKALTIIGAGAGKTGSIIDGQQLARSTAVVRVRRVDPLELRSLSITGGKRLGADGDRGGGIENSGQLTLTRVRVTGNQSSAGGGIWMETSSRLTLNAGTAVTRNTAVNDGGGIFSNGALILNAGSSVTENDAGAGGGGILVAQGSLTIEPGATLADNEPNDCFGTGCPT